MGRRVVPVREPCPSLPEPRKPRKPQRTFGPNEMFAFDTETTRCGKKELRSCQFAYRDGAGVTIEMYWLDGWFQVDEVKEVRELLEGHYDYVRCVNYSYKTLRGLRKAIQVRYEELLYGDQPRVRRNKFGKMRKLSRRVLRCAVAFNANFDLGVIADRTTLHPEMGIGGMEGAGCKYDFTSGKRQVEDEEFGLSIDCLFLGAFSVPFCSKRGEIWDIQALTRTLWGAANLASVGKVVGLDKLTGQNFDSYAYAAVDAVITLMSAEKLTGDLLEMGFTGQPDRFISGATVAKDLMKRHYTPFYLTQQQHEFVWPAYFGGMTGALNLDMIREPQKNLVYGDLDGAYNASGQKLEVFKWGGVEWVTGRMCEKIVRAIRNKPSRYWEFGSLHLHVKGDFDNLPVRVGTCGEGGTPTASEGLVWARVNNFDGVLSIGDFLHSRPLGRVQFIEGVLRDRSKDTESACLFAMTAKERANYPKKIGGVDVKENYVPNTWWKLAGNTLYGSMANRNGKHRESSGTWFNAILASSITGAIRHCMWVVNENSDATYNDTDSALTSVEGFNRAVEALKPLDIGFSNKTSDELPNCDVAAEGVVQGSKRYALIAEDGTFGAKCHGLGSWFVLIDGRVQSVAHNEEVLQAVWSLNYPEIFGEPDTKILALPAFHKFSIKTLKIANMVQEYARRQWNIPLENISAYGKAGNFGYLSPTIEVQPNRKHKIVVKVSYEAEDASSLSDLTLGEVAFAWGQSYDKKFDYENLKRWEFEYGDTVNVRAVEHSQNIVESNALSDTDISVHTNHDADRS